MIKSNRSKRLKNTNTNLQKSNNYNYPPLPTISSYFSLLSPILLKHKHLPLYSLKNKTIQQIHPIKTKEEEKTNSQYHQKDPVITSPIVLRTPKIQSSIHLSSSNEIDSNSAENLSNSSSSYFMSYISKLSEYQHISLPNLTKKLNALTTTNLQSLPNSYCL